MEIGKVYFRKFWNYDTDWIKVLGPYKNPGEYRVLCVKRRVLADLPAYETYIAHAEKWTLATNPDYIPNTLKEM